MTDAESTPIIGIGELTTNDGDDETCTALNDAALGHLWGLGGVDRTGLAGADRGPGGRPDLTNTPRWGR